MIQNFNTCEICKKMLTDEDHAIKIKKKDIFKDMDNTSWWNFSKAYICGECLSEIRKRRLENL